MKKRRWIIVGLIAVVLLAAFTLPAFGRSGQGDNELGVVFTHNGQVIGWMQIYPLPGGPELEMASRSNTTAERSSVWIQAEPHEGAPSGVVVHSSTEDFEGVVTILADGSAQLYITPRGARLAGGSELLFWDDDHRLYRCGDDLCWWDGQQVIVLSE